MFGRKQDPPPVVDSPQVPEPPQPTVGKGRPTPKRKEAEARNRKPLVPEDRRAAAREARAKAREQRELEYQAMRTGDERYMPARDKGPVRRFVRDSVDARWNLGEFFLPVAAFFIVLQFVTARATAAVAVGALLALYAFIIAAVLDAWLMWRRLRARIVAKFGESTPLRGLAMYAVMRAFQVRPSRLPKPQVKHGQHPS